MCAATPIASVTTMPVTSTARNSLVVMPGFMAAIKGPDGAQRNMPGAGSTKSPNSLHSPGPNLASSAGKLRPSMEQSHERFGEKAGHHGHTGPGSARSAQAPAADARRTNRADSRGQRGGAAVFRQGCARGLSHGHRRDRQSREDGDRGRLAQAQ